MATAQELAREKAAKLLRRRGSASSLASSHAKVVQSGRHGSISTTSFQQEESTRGFAPKYENSYRLEPNNKFNASTARDIAESILESYLGEERYEPELCASMSKQLSEVIRGRVKVMCPRYKIVVMVSIGQLGGQDMRVTSRCLWDAAHDNSATANYSNDTLFAVAYIFAVYYD